MKLIREFTEEPSFIIEEGLGKEKQFFIEGIFLQSEIKNKNGRMYPESVMDAGVARYIKERVSNNQGFGELGHPACMLYDNFDVLSNDGWRPFLDLAVGDYVLAQDSNGITKESPITHITNEQYSGESYHFLGRHIDSIVTPTHRFYLIDRNGSVVVRNAKEIYDNPARSAKERIIKTISYSGETPEFITIPGIADLTPVELNRYNEDVSKDLLIKTEDFVKFLGIWLAEGNLQKPYRINISQNIGEKLDKIKELFEKLPFVVNENIRESDDRTSNVILSFSDRRLYEYLKPLGNCYSKYIPEEIKKLDAKYLKDLVWWFAIGDGRSKKNGDPLNVFTTSYRLAEDLQECLIKAGYTGKLSAVESTKDYKFAGRTILAKNKKPLYLLRVSYVDGIYLDQRHPFTIEKKNLYGKACCITTEEGNFYIRDAGKVYLTGNSPAINLDRVSHLITSLIKEGSNYVGRAKILDTPNGKIAKGILEGGGKLGVSSRALGTLRMNNEGVNVVQNDFFLTTAGDLVADPSAPDAFIRGIMENKEWVFVDGHFEERQINEAKKAIRKASSKLITETSLHEFEKFLKSLK